MVLLRNSLLRKCAPEQMSWSAAERVMLCTTKKFVKSVSARITSQPIKINGKSSAYFLSLFLCWCDASSWRIVRRRTFRHGRQNSHKNWRSRRCTSHAWRSALIVQRTETFLYNILPGNFGASFLLFLTRFITRELAFSVLLQHCDLKWLKTEVVSPGRDA